MGRADLHLHTRVSDGMASIEDVLLRAEAEDLDVVAITDHEDATGGHRARELAARQGLRVQVLVGAEVTTVHGHLLALDIDRSPKSFRSIERTLEDIHAQGGLVIVPHPLSWMTRSVSRRTMDRITRRREPGISFDAIETHNPSPAGRATARRAALLNVAWDLPETGSSDAHHLPHVGSGWTQFEGSSAEDLLSALRQGRIVPGMRDYASVRAVGVRQTLLGLAWGYCATPRKMLRRGQPNPGHTR